MLIKGGRVAASGAFDDVLRPYDSLRVRLLGPAQSSTIRAALAKFNVALDGSGEAGEFLVTVSGKADIPSMIKAMIEGGLQPVSVEPGEITYEGGAK
jgi:hypothetical protein